MIVSMEDTRPCIHHWFYCFDTNYNYCVDCGIYKERQKKEHESGDLLNYNYKINNKGVI